MKRNIVNVAQPKEKHSSSHFLTRRQILISRQDYDNCYLSGSLGRKTTGKQLCKDVIGSCDYSKEINIYSTFFFLCYYRLETDTPCFFCFPRNFSVELISNLTSLFFLLEKCILALQPCISVAIPCFFILFLSDCQYLKHYSMTLLCSKMDYFAIFSP